jgi:hypothetical protein
VKGCSCCVLLCRPNSHNLGLQGYGRGAYLDIIINMQLLATPIATPQQLQKRYLSVFFTTGQSDSGSVIVAGRLECLSGCSCSRMPLVGQNDESSTALSYSSTAVSMQAVSQILLSLRALMLVCKAYWAAASAEARATVLVGVCCQLRSSCGNHHMRSCNWSVSKQHATAAAWCHLILLVALSR